MDSDSGVGECLEVGDNWEGVDKADVGEVVFGRGNQPAYSSQGVWEGCVTHSVVQGATAAAKSFAGFRCSRCLLLLHLLSSF